MKRLRVLPRAALDVEESSVFYLLEAGEAVSIRFETAVMETFAWILEHPMTGAPRASG